MTVKDWTIIYFSIGLLYTLIRIPDIEREARELPEPNEDWDEEDKLEAEREAKRSYTDVLVSEVIVTVLFWPVHVLSIIYGCFR